MRELKRLYLNHSDSDSGKVVLMTEELDDAWHLYNLVSPGDLLTASTVRKVKIDKGSLVTSDKKRITLTIAVEKSDYDGAAGTVRFSGTNVEENEYVKLGQYHTTEIHAPSREKVTLFKSEWDSVDIETLREACNPSKAAEVAVLLIDDAGVAGLYALTSVLVRDLWTLHKTIPRQEYSHANKTIDKFRKEVMAAVKHHLDFEVVSCLVIAGPGFAPENFLSSISDPHLGDPNLAKLKSKMISARCSGAFKHCIDELLSDPKVKGRIADTRAAEHSRALDSFYKRLESDPDRTCYGPIPVEKAIIEGAVSDLLVTDKLFRSANAAMRRKYAKMVDVVNQSRGTVHVFSEQHITGQQLNQLGGVAAMLRYAISEE